MKRPHDSRQNAAVLAVQASEKASLGIEWEAVQERGARGSRVEGALDAGTDVVVAAQLVAAGTLRAAEIWTHLAGDGHILRTAEIHMALTAGTHIAVQERGMIPVSVGLAVAAGPAATAPGCGAWDVSQCAVSCSTRRSDL